MRILRRRGKCKEIDNILNIPEVDKYNYLGITINQSLKLKDHENKMRTIESCIGYKTKLLGRILETMKGKCSFLKLYLDQDWIIELII